MDQDRTDLASLDDWRWDERWMEDAQRRGFVFDESERVIVRTAGVLRDVLMCDDLRFLPSADALRPVFSLLLKFPEVEDKVVGAAILSLQLDASVVGGRDGDDRIQAGLRRANNLSEAMALFPKTVDSAGLSEALGQAQSMQNRWVSLLYWLQRDLAARDYGGQGLPLDVHARAHKEHIVPFSLLHPAFTDLEARGGHGRTHLANSIGNLTFLSEDFNLAHGSEPVPLWEIDQSLLGPHQLADDATLVAYRRAVEGLRAQRYEDGVAAYVSFVEGRLRLLSEALHDWVVRLIAVDAVNPGLRPIAQVVRPSSEDEVRARQWPSDFESVVLDLIRSAGTNGTKWVLFKSGGSRVTYKLRLYQDGTWLAVGKGLPQAERLAEALDPIITPHEENGQWWYRLDPKTTESANLLQALAATRPWTDESND